MKTLVQFIDNLQAGGKERQCVELVKGLAARGGWRIVVVTMTPELFFTELLALPGVHVEHLVRRSRRDPWVAWRFWRLCRRWQASLVAAWHVMPALYAVPATRLLRIPLLVAFIQDAPAVMPPVLARRARWAFRAADAVVGNSRAGLQAYGPPAQKARLIPSGFDLARATATLDPQWLRREYGLQAPHIVGMVATFSHYKDHPTLIDAALQVLARRNDVVFVMVGGGPTLAAVQALIPPERQAQLRVLGRVAAPIEQVVCAFDIGVLATFTEGMSNSIAEYMMLGKPVVASDGGGTADLVEDGVTGHLVPQRDAKALAARLLALLADPEARTRMGAAGRARIEREFRMERIVDQFEAVHQALLGAAR